MYSPITSGPQLIEWNEIYEPFSDNDSFFILLGDFNCNHSTWDGHIVLRHSISRPIEHYCNPRDFLDDTVEYT